MDKQLLHALDNLSQSLEEISKILNSKKEAKSATANALKGGDFGNQLKEINAGIKSIKSDTQTILKNQKTILELSKSRNEKNGLFDNITDKKQESSLKKGVSTVVLIAGAVLAIGLAFKLIGSVDFASVIALALALPLIALAFEKITSALMSTGFDAKKDGINFVLSIGSIALGIALASWALQLVRPIGFAQFATTVFIAITFSIVAVGIKKMLKAFDGMDMKDLVKSVIFLPLILPAIGLGIALASYSLQLVQPMSLSNFIGAIMVGAVFTVLAFGLKPILNAFKDVKMSDVMMASFSIPVLFTAMSLAIMLSSSLLSKVVPVNFMQLLVSVAIAVIFLIIGYTISPLMKVIGSMKWEDLAKVPIFFTIMSIAIMASSHILAQTADIDWSLLLKIAALGVILGVIMLIMSMPIKIIGKIPIQDILLGSLGIIAIAGAIMISSHILALGNYTNYPDPSWTLGVALSMLAFIPAVLVLGIIAMTGVGALAILAGAGMVLAVAGTIVAASYILSKGKYDKGPSVEWSTSVSLALAAFATGMVLLGGIVVGTLGLGALALAAGSDAVLGVAHTIVKTSFILKKGNYTGGPTKEWAQGISLALGAFAPIYNMLMMNGIMKIFGGGGVGPDDFAKAINTISLGIVDAAWFFQGAKVAFKGGPSEEWARGVGNAIGAFAPVYKVLSEQDGWFKDGPSVDDMKNAIITISHGIISSAEIFAQNKSKFIDGNYPTEEWGRGVGSAISAFAPVFKSLSEDSGWITSGDEVINNMTNGVIKIAKAIVRVGGIFNMTKLDWKAYPSKMWSYFVKVAIRSFVGLSKTIEEEDPDYNKAIYASNRLVRFAKILYSGNKYFSLKIDPNYIKNAGQNIMDFTSLIRKLVEMEGSSDVFDKLGSATNSLLGTDPITQIARRMLTLASGYDAMANSLNKLGSAMKVLNIKDMKSLAGLSKELSGVNLQQNDRNNKTFEVVKGNITQTVGKRGDNNIKQGSQKGSQNQNMSAQLEKVINLLSQINNSTTSLDEYISEMTDGRISGPPKV